MKINPNNWNGFLSTLIHLLSSHNSSGLGFTADCEKETPYFGKTHSSILSATLAVWVFATGKQKNCEKADCSRDLSHALRKEVVAFHKEPGLCRFGRYASEMILQAARTSTTVICWTNNTQYSLEINKLSVFWNATTFLKLNVNVFKDIIWNVNPECKIICKFVYLQGIAAGTELSLLLRYKSSWKPWKKKKTSSLQPTFWYGKAATNRTGIFPVLCFSYSCRSGMHKHARKKTPHLWHLFQLPSQMKHSNSRNLPDDWEKGGLHNTIIH